MRPINKKCVIISAEDSTCSDNFNKRETDELESILKKRNASYKHLVGSYRGHREASFLVELDDNFDLDSAKYYSHRFGQESILLLDEDRNASLHYLDDQWVDDRIGKLKAITNNEAIKLEAWSYCPLNNQFYGVL